MERQLATSLIGPKNVTRAVLPVMRKQRSVHVISISSGAGLMGFEFNSACGAAKFGLEGGQRRCSPRSPRSASTPPSSTPGSSAPSFSLRLAVKDTLRDHPERDTRASSRGAVS